MKTVGGMFYSSAMKIFFIPLKCHLPGLQLSKEKKKRLADHLPDVAGTRKIQRSAYNKYSINASEINA